MKIYHIHIIILLALSINVFAENPVRERVYVQTDKQTYISGELLWMKLYLTSETGLPSSFSKIGYVEILDESASLVQTKLDIVDGIGEGWMELPVSLPTGYYILKAYTRNMRNEGEPVFFEKTIAIINTFRSDVTVKTDTLHTDEDTSPVPAGNITVVTDNQSYKPRTRNEVRIQNLPENVHSLCVSIAGKDFAQSSSGIMDWSSRLLANYHVPFKNDFLPEYEGHIINGKIIDVATNQPAAKEDGIFALLGFVGEGIRLFGGNVENGSDVSFFTTRIAGTHEIAISTVTSSNNRYRINIETPFVSHSERNIPEFRLNKDWENQLLKRSVGLQVLLAYTADSMSLVDTTYSFFQWKADRSYILDEYTRFTSMEELVIEFLRPLRFRNYNGKRYLSVFIEESATTTIGNSIVLLDGIPILDHDIIRKYNPLLIKKIEIYTDRFVFGGMHFEGLVSISTYKNDYPGLVMDATTNLFDYEGTQVHRYFYTPAYSGQPGENAMIPDYRHTLLWMPEVNTGGQQSISIPFSTSDLTGDFQVTVEGITKNGDVIRGVSFFEVEQ